MIELSKEAREWLTRQAIPDTYAAEILAALDSAVGREKAARLDHHNACDVARRLEAELSAANERAEALETTHSSVVSARDLTIRDLRAEVATVSADRERWLDLYNAKTRAYHSAHDQLTVADASAEAYRKEVERLQGVIRNIGHCPSCRESGERDTRSPAVMDDKCPNCRGDGLTAIARDALAASPQPAKEPTRCEFGTPGCELTGTVGHWCAGRDGASFPTTKSAVEGEFRRVAADGAMKLPCTCPVIQRADPSRHFRECSMRAAYPEPSRAAGSIPRIPDSPETRHNVHPTEPHSGLCQSVRGPYACDCGADERAKRMPSKLHVTGHNTFGAIKDEAEARHAHQPGCPQFAVVHTSNECLCKPEAPAVEAPVRVTLIQTVGANVMDAPAFEVAACVLDQYPDPSNLRCPAHGLVLLPWYRAGRLACPDSGCMYTEPHACEANGRQCECDLPVFTAVHDTPRISTPCAQCNAQGQCTDTCRDAKRVEGR